VVALDAIHNNEEVEFDDVLCVFIRPEDEHGEDDEDAEKANHGELIMENQDAHADNGSKTIDEAAPVDNKGAAGT